MRKSVKIDLILAFYVIISFQKDNLLHFVSYLLHICTNILQLYTI